MGLMEMLITKGVTPENVSVFGQLMELQKQIEARDAEKQFNAAFVALQRETTKIKATKIVPNKDKSVKYRYAPYEDIMEEVQPKLVQHGFAISFSTAYEGPRVVVTCNLFHEGGHSKSNSFAARIGGGPPGANECQSDGAAATYAKRFALCQALNIVIEQDTDGSDDYRNLGKPITKDQAENLRKMLVSAGGNEKLFLEYAAAGQGSNGTITFDEIMDSQYESLREKIAEIAKRRSRPKPPAEEPKLDPVGDDGAYKWEPGK